MVDFSKITTYPIKERQNKFSVEDMIPLENSNSIDDPAIESLAEAVVEAKRKKGIVVVMLGGAVIKVGCSLLLIDLMKKGFIDHIAVNGAVSIHDFEVALIGETSEDVERGLEDGRFGMVEETGKLLNEAIREGHHRKMGYGQAVGHKIKKMELPYQDFSLFYHGVRLNIPITVHVAIGGDIIHQHPICDGAALGSTSFFDFKLLTDSVSRLKEGVLLNVGSAVNLPEVFLKALTITRNLKYDVGNFTTANFDFIDMYRPRTRRLEWPKKLGCQSYDIRADHKHSLPTLHRWIVEKTEKSI
ncbi:MAG: hypothetical protein GY866_12540 [Proteobacteria bacterium]|nr:hypothetical protein [Pseudomonadota bacterium]